VQSCYTPCFQSEAVAATGHGSNRFWTEHLAQQRDLLLEVILFDDETGPDQFQ
jgi:hypothetical protein